MLATSVLTSCSHLFTAKTEGVSWPSSLLRCPELGGTATPETQDLSLICRLTTPYLHLSGAHGEKGLGLGSVLSLKIRGRCSLKCDGVITNTSVTYI